MCCCARWTNCLARACLLIAKIEGHGQAVAHRSIPKDSRAPVEYEIEHVGLVLRISDVLSPSSNFKSTAGCCVTNLRVACRHGILRRKIEYILQIGSQRGNGLQIAGPDPGCKNNLAGIVPIGFERYGTPRHGKRVAHEKSCSVLWRPFERLLVEVHG